MSNTIIQVENLGKNYRIGVEKKAPNTWTGKVTNIIGAPFQYLSTMLREPSPEEIIWALRGVSFEVKQGEVVGIIGNNGAGKSTLLKLLTRITEPSEGCARLHGRVGSLLEVGTGFHPELTGRENVYLNGAVLGMNKTEIKRKFDEIIDFSGVETFIDTPVKRYSSGMKVRLAFAVAANLEPEILLIDEVLAVGDAAFQKKCMGKMNDVASHGRTILFVSHNMEAIMRLCTRTIWLDSGSKKIEGPSAETVHKYLAASRERSKHVKLIDRDDRTGNGKICFTEFRMQDEKGNHLEVAATGHTIDFIFSYVTNGEPFSKASVWFWIHDDMNRQLLCLWSRLTGDDFKSLPPKGELICRIPRFPLAQGIYSIEVLKAAVDGASADKITAAATLEVIAGDFFGTGGSYTDIGEYMCYHSWKYREIS